MTPIVLIALQNLHYFLRSDNLSPRTINTNALLFSHHHSAMPSRTQSSISHRFVSYRSLPNSRPRVGLVDANEENVSEVLGYVDLFELIEAHPDLDASHEFDTGTVTPLSSVEILAPLPGRDVLYVDILSPSPNCSSDFKETITKRQFYPLKIVALARTVSLAFFRRSVQVLILTGHRYCSRRGVSQEWI